MANFRHFRSQPQNISTSVAIKIERHDQVSTNQYHRPDHIGQENRPTLIGQAGEYR